MYDNVMNQQREAIYQEGRRILTEKDLFRTGPCQWWKMLWRAS